MSRGPSAFHGGFPRGTRVAVTLRSGEHFLDRFMDRTDTRVRFALRGWIDRFKIRNYTKWKPTLHGAFPLPATHQEAETQDHEAFDAERSDVQAMSAADIALREDIERRMRAAPEAPLPVPAIGVPVMAAVQAPEAPTEGETMRAEKGKQECPECHTLWTNLGTHRAKAHGVRGTSSAAQARWKARERAGASAPQAPARRVTALGRSAPGALPVESAQTLDGVRRLVVEHARLVRENARLTKIVERLRTALR